MAAMADNPRSQASKATGQCLQRYLAATMRDIKWHTIKYGVDSYWSWLIFRDNRRIVSGLTDEFSDLSAFPG